MTKAAAAMAETNELKPKQRQALRMFLEKVEYWSRFKDTSPPHEFAERVLKESGYIDMWQKEHTDDSVKRLDSLSELIGSLKEFESLDEFLEHAAIAISSDGNESGDMVSIMTLHAAKGLEFETVFLPGWEQGLFPHRRSIDEDSSEPDEDNSGLEEERRLAYVGLTRAKKRAKIYFTHKRFSHGLSHETRPSDFIYELPEDHVEIVGSDAVDCAASDLQQETQKDEDLKPPTRAKSEMQPIDVGSRVVHERFGPGTVVTIDSGKLIVDFDRNGRKTVLSTFLEAA